MNKEWDYALSRNQTILATNILMDGSSTFLFATMLWIADRVSNNVLVSPLV